MYCQVYDTQLKCLCSVKISELGFTNFESVTANEAAIFCLVESGSKVVRLNWSLELMDTTFMQTNNAEAPFYLAPDAAQIFVHGERFFSRHAGRMRIMELASGALRTFFALIDNEFQVDARRQLVMVKTRDNRQLTYYDYEGEVVYEHALVGFPAHSNQLEFFVDDKSELYFYKPRDAVCNLYYV